MKNRNVDLNKQENTSYSQRERLNIIYLLILWNVKLYYKLTISIKIKKNFLKVRKQASASSRILLTGKIRVDILYVSKCNKKSWNIYFFLCEDSKEEMQRRNQADPGPWELRNITVVGVLVWFYTSIKNCQRLSIFAKCSSPQSNHEKPSDTLKLRDNLQNIWPVLFKSVKVMTHKYIWRDSLRPMETKKTRKLGDGELRRPRVKVKRCGYLRWMSRKWM